MRLLWYALLVTGVVWLYAWLCVLKAAGQPEFSHPSFVYDLKAHNTFDFREIQFFELKSINGSATVAVDGDVDLSKVLRQFSGQRVRITFEPVSKTLTRIER